MSEKLNKKGTLERFIPILMILAVALAFVVGILWQKVRNLESGEGVGNGTEQPADFPNQLPPEGKLSEEQAANIPEITEKDYIRGSKDARVFLIEYSDFECPFCKDFHETAQQIVDEYDGQVGWVYRHFPLDVLHAKARTEAIAAECAAELGGNDGFWAFIDKIYEITPSN
ncbi:MAG: thioredoxin domain-containing protein, partial [Microgenomates group bacterium]